MPITCPDFLGWYRKRDIHNRENMGERAMSVGVETAASYVDEDEEATFKQKSPQASERTKQRIKEKSCCFRKGFLAYPVMRLPK